jgi:hypothetical protein
MKQLIVTLGIGLAFFSFAANLSGAETECCAQHKGRCGERCCDGVSLAVACRETYAEFPSFAREKPPKASPSAEKTETRQFSRDQPQKTNVSGKEEIKTPASNAPSLKKIQESQDHSGKTALNSPQK